MVVFICFSIAVGGAYYLPRCLGGTWLYSQDIGNLAYVRIIFLFVLVLCVSDVINRTVCTIKFPTKFLLNFDSRKGDD